MLVSSAATYMIDKLRQRNDPDEILKVSKDWNHHRSDGEQMPSADGQREESDNLPELGGYSRNRLELPSAAPRNSKRLKGESILRIQNVMAFA